MYIKKPVLVIYAIILVIVVALGTVMVVNPFGPLQFDDLFKFSRGVYVVKKMYYEDISESKLVDGALRGVAWSTGDIYTEYMDADEAKKFKENVDATLSGIGVVFISNTIDNKITVKSIVKGSPAEKAGIEPGDEIVKIDGIAASELGADAADKIKGPEGTNVTLELLKKSTGQTTELTLTRAVIKIETVSSKMLDSEVGYIHVTQFAEETYSEFVRHFNSLCEQKMKKLVIDLRNNHGGYIVSATQIADEFINDGMIVYTLDKNNKKVSYEADGDGVKVPIVLVTNGETASASEILVGALKDHGLAKSVGEKTFGKGVTQIPYEFYDGSMMKVTNSRYYTPNGVCINNVGIVPDVEVKMSEEKAMFIPEIAYEEDDQLKMAVEVLKTMK